MTTLAGAIVGLLAGTGVWLAIAGWRGVALPDRSRRSIDVEGLWWRAALVVVAFLAAVVVTGWPAAGALAAASAGVAPMLAGVRSSRERLTRRSDAVAAWAEMLRDTIASHAGLQEAIAVTARVAPAPIRSEVQTLAVRAERETLTAITQAEGKPEQAISKIVDGRLGAWFKDQVLIDQPYVKDDKQTIAQLLDSKSKGMTVSDFKRVAIGA